MKQIKKVTIFLFLIIGIGVSVAYKSNFFEIAKQLEIYTTLFKELNMYYIDDINPAKINQLGINSMLQSLDPYTHFYDEQGVENARINANDQYKSTGLKVKFIDGKLFVVDVIENTPASISNIFIGDEIKSINNINVNVNNKKTVLTQLKGLSGSNILIKFKRQEKTFKKALKLKPIILNSVPYFKMLPNKTGYIVLTVFNEKAFENVESAFLDLKKQGMTKLILDLRNNPGGYLNQAINIISLFVAKGSLVVTTKAKIKKLSNTYKTQKEPLDLSIPLAILINGQSASASEIVSGSLQDMDRAVIIGSRSFGKGLVQVYRKLVYGTQLKLTISKYYTPSGRNIQELDYTDRVGDSIPKFSDNERPKFKTKKGRIVLGGGGILPDIVVKNRNSTQITKALLKGDAIFNFANQYFYQHQKINSVKNFSLKESDIQNFINQVKLNNKFKSPIQKSFISSQEKAKKAGLNISKLSIKLNNLILQEQIKQLQKDKKEISIALTKEIIRHYYFDRGVYQYKIKNDILIKKAGEVLNNNNIYKNILKIN